MGDLFGILMYSVSWGTMELSHLSLTNFSSESLFMGSLVVCAGSGGDGYDWTRLVLSQGSYREGTVYRADDQTDGKAGRRKPWMPAILATLAIAAVLEGQVTGTPSSRTPEARKATRLVRFLELPDRRSQAVVDLLRMGEGSVNALVLGLDHPREDIVFTCLHMLRTLGPRSSGSTNSPSNPTTPIDSRTATRSWPRKGW